jgi:hypothetical protein
MEFVKNLGDESTAVWYTFYTIMDPSFEKRKQELLEKIDSLRGKNDDAAVSPAADKDAEVAIYGAHNPFLDDFVLDLRKERAIAAFHDVEAAIGYCFDHPVRSVLLCMDPPTDWKMSTDVFTNVKMMKPDVRFILLTKTPAAIPVRTLAAQSAIVLAKPFKMDDLRSLLDPS